MKKEEYYNKSLDELFNLADAAEERLKKYIPRDLFLAATSLLCPLPINLLLLGGVAVDYEKRLRNAKFWRNNFNNLYLTSREYQDVYQVYKIILEELSELLKKIEFDNEMKIFAGYYYLLKNGYLSVDHNFYYSHDVDYDRFLHGINIMEGYGKCLNIASMLTDLLRINNYEAYNINMTLTDDTLSVLNSDFLLRDKEEKIEKDHEDKIENGDAKIVLKSVDDLIKINHLATLFRDNVHSYIIDPTNNTVFLIDFEKQVYQGDTNYYVQYLRWFNKGSKNNLETLLKQTDTKLLEKLFDDYDGIYNICPDYTDIFEKFYKEHQCLYEEVVAKKKILVRESKIDN